jgi:hypothetical protein
MTKDKEMTPCRPTRVSMVACEDDGSPFLLGALYSLFYSRNRMLLAIMNDTCCNQDAPVSPS